MPSQSPDGGFPDPLDQTSDHLCTEFENAWRAGKRISIEECLDRVKDLERDSLQRRLLRVEIDLRRQDGEKPSFSEYELRFAENSRVVRSALCSAGCLPFERIGDYQVCAWLGDGGFGEVYRCWDERAERAVAIKLAHRDRFTSTEAAQAILHEGRRVSQLHHPGIVDLYQVGEDHGDCFLVYRFVDGMSLETLLRQGPILHDQGASLVAQIADALNHAHGKQLFHRDVKPANILIDSQGQPLITDFGLAVREQDLQKERGRISGTFPYMSPEQVRGEGHRIDGRSDIYGLGVVLYEILCERRPFRGTDSEILDQILHREPQPPRQLNSSIAPELERICLKAMAKQMKARFLTAGDMADDLRATLAGLRPVALPDMRDEHIDNQGLETLEAPAPPQSSHPSVSVVPKGLRSFGPEDSDFFLELLPGPRDRHRLPDSIRFWKTRIESRDPETTFSVGLVYGPSGCGKSSLIRAGLLPRLESKVKPVYVEAAHDKTKSRLMKSLQKVRSSLTGERSLPAMLACLRRSGGSSGGGKTLIVLDQFEQWLHAHGRDMESTQLVAALRQADGIRVQVLLMVRDDFWMSISRLFECLEINLDFERNARAVDLFDASHARRVLRLFGEAHDRLPAQSKELTRDQAGFLDRAVAGLSQDGRVIPVRLSLFADLMKDWPWTSAGFNLVGGPEGVGVRFLEQTFSGPTALPDLRAVEKPGRAVLQALLPECGADIKGRMRSQEDLAKESGLSAHPTRFARLLEILDRELHIITPVDPEGEEGVGGQEEGVRVQGSGVSKEDGDKDELDSFERRFRNALHGGKSEPAQDDLPPTVPAPSYQLTHDYLVPALRSWLTEERRKTWRGRAELCLEERTAQWGRSRDRRFLPSTTEFLAITLGVPTRQRNTMQKEMMGAASRHYALRGSAALGLVLLLTFLPLYTWNVRSRSRQNAAEAVCNELFSARAEQVPEVIASVQSHGDLAKPILQKRFQDSFPDSISRLRAALGLAALGSPELKFIADAIPKVSADECGNIVTALKSVQDEAVEELSKRAFDKEEAARARYALVLLNLGSVDAAKSILALDKDPTMRTNFIHGLKSWHGDLGPVASILRGQADPAMRSGLIAALGLMGKSSPEVMDQLLPVVEEIYREAPDGGSHSAAAYTLRRWGEKLPAVSADHDGWFVNSQGADMLKVTVGDRTICVCAHKVTVQEFQEFMKDGAAEKPHQWPGPKPDISPTPNCPVQNVSWEDALLFCNWLSTREGQKRTPCYQKTGAKIKGKFQNRDGKFTEIECAVWVWDIHANGYRLPTEREWGKACRAGTTTRFSFGHDLDKLPLYAVSRATHTEPDGKLLPNAWGFFGMHGSVSEFCWDHDQKNIRRYGRGGNYLVQDDGSKITVPSPLYRIPTFGFRVVCNGANGLRTR